MRAYAPGFDVLITYECSANDGVLFLRDTHCNCLLFHTIKTEISEPLLGTVRGTPTAQFPLFSSNSIKIFICYKVMFIISVKTRRLYLSFTFGNESQAITT
jgi:hypothetical protein